MRSLLRKLIGRGSDAQRGVSPRAGDLGDFTESEQLRLVDLLPEQTKFFDQRVVSSETLRTVSEEKIKAPYLAASVHSEGAHHPTEGRVRWGFSGTETAILAEYDPLESRIRLLVGSGAQERYLSAELKSAPLLLTLTLTERRLVVWQGAGAEVSPCLWTDLSAEEWPDPRAVTTLDELRLVHEGSGIHLIAGYFGYLGLRDPQFLRSADGSPLEESGRLLLTMTCAGPGHFRTAHWGLFSCDPGNPRDLVLEKHIFSERDGRVLGDHAGNIVTDDPGMILVTSSWGDFDHDAHIRWSRIRRTELLDWTRQDRRALTVTTERLAVPTSWDSWDPTVINHEDRWWIGFVECRGYQPRFDFRPALGRSAPGAAFGTGFERIGADTLHHQTEGPLFTQYEGEWVLLASDGDARDYPAYDLTMFRFGQVKAPYRTNIPHPLIYRGAQDSWLLTFDGSSRFEEVFGYGTHGDLLIYREKPGRST